jgi:hypothetical protein
VVTHLKQMKQKRTTKGLAVSERTHQKLKVYCAKLGVKINETADKLLREAMAK